MQNGFQDDFDIWSKNCEKTEIDCSKKEYVESYLMSLSQVCEGTNYLEKMPEHALRINFLREVKPKKVIFVDRCWVDVALSITKFCQEDWYGYKDAKWNCLKTCVDPD